MAVLTDLVCYSSGLHPEFAAVTALEIEDAVLGGGGFGSNHVCRSLNGVQPPAPGLVVKILNDNGAGSEAAGFATIRKLQAGLARLEAYRRTRGEPPLRDVPGLIAVPQFAFTAKRNGMPVSGYAALRLDTCGYIPFEKYTEGNNADLLLAYQSLSLRDKLRIAGDFVEAFHLLALIGYVHGDINPQNLFVNVAQRHCAVIDFDSGAMVEQAGDQPGTWGKPNDWLAPEITRQLCGIGSGGGRRVNVDAYSDLWSVGVGVHYLLFLFHPLFYLRDFGENTLKAYFTSGAGWPVIAPASPLFNAPNAPTYAHYFPQVVGLPMPLKNMLARLVNRGMLQPGKRPTPQEWQTALRSAFAPMRISRFAVDTPIVRIGGAVTLSWDAENAERLYIDGVGDVTGLSQIRATVNRDTAFTLHATGATGTVVSLALPPVRVYRLPSPPVPSPPPDPPRLRWDRALLPEFLQKGWAAVSRFALLTALPVVGRYVRLFRFQKPQRIILPRIALPKW